MQQSPWEANRVSASQEIPPHFTELEGSLSTFFGTEGNMESGRGWGLIDRGLRKMNGWLYERGISLWGNSWNWPGWRSPLLGNPKDMLSKARKCAPASIGAPIWGNMEVCFFLMAFLFRGIFVRFSREMQMLCKRVSLSIETLLGNLEGVHFTGFLKEKKKYVYIWVPFLDPEDIKCLSLGAIWNFSKGTGLSWVGRLWGTKGLSIWPRCFGNVRARTQY